MSNWLGKFTSALFNEQKRIVSTIIVDQENSFFPVSYYFTTYDDGSYSLYDVDNCEYLAGYENPSKKSIIKSISGECTSRDPVLLGKNRHFYNELVRSYENDLYSQAHQISEALGFANKDIMNFYYYGPEEPNYGAIFSNYEKMRKAFMDKCDELGIDYEKNSDVIIERAVRTINEVNKRKNPDFYIDSTHCYSIDNIIGKYNAEVSGINNPDKLESLSKHYTFMDAELTAYPAEYLSLDDKAMVNLVKKKGVNRELLKQYTEFLISFPTYAQILSTVSKCSKDAAKRRDNLRMESFTRNGEFIANLDRMIEHDNSQNTYFYHVPQNRSSAMSICNDGLYMYSDDIYSTSFGELKRDTLLHHGYGSQFNTYDDYIVVIDKPNDEEIVRPLSNDEAEVASVMPRRIGLSTRPTHIIDPSHIVGYIDKRHQTVVYNDKYIGKKVGDRHEK